MQSMQESGDPNLEELKAFVAVATLGSFAGAARKLGRDSSVLSRRIHALEKRLGVRLLARTTRAVVVTEAGAQYLRRIQNVLDELDAANLEASDIAGTPRGVLRLSLPHAFGHRWIAPLLPAFIARYPQVRVDARFTDRYVDMVAEGFDLALRIGQLADSSYVTRRIGTHRTMLAASPAYLERRGVPMQPEDLAAHDCLGFSGYITWPRWPLAKGGERLSFEPKGPLVADSSEVLLQAALAGLGIVFAPDWHIVQYLRSGELVELLPGWGASNDGPVNIVHPPGRIVPAKSRVFVEMVIERLGAGWQWPEG
jgi:DNA-binding transcriptional LysR family regulator